MARRYFGTDGVRGVVGEDLTAGSSSGSAVRPPWSDGGRVFVGRDTRGSGPELEAAFAEGVASAGGNAVLGGVLPTPAVALLALDLGAVISASHNPPEYNGVKFFDRGRAEAHRRLRGGDRGAPRRAAAGRCEARSTGVESSAEGYLEHVLERFGSDLNGLRIAVDCANGAYSEIAPRGFRAARRRRPAAGDRARRPQHQRRLRRDRPLAAAEPRRRVRPGRRVRRRRRPDARGRRRRQRGRRRPDPRRPRPPPRRSTSIVVTAMTNLGFHRLMAERGIRVVTTDVGDRYVLEALRREGANPRRRAVRPRHLPRRPRHRRRSRGRAAPLPRARGPLLGRGGSGHAEVRPGQRERSGAEASASRSSFARRSPAERGARRNGACSRPSVGY